MLYLEDPEAPRRYIVGALLACLGRGPRANRAEGPRTAPTMARRQGGVSDGALLPKSQKSNQTSIIHACVLAIFLLHSVLTLNSTNLLPPHPIFSFHFPPPIPGSINLAHCFVAAHFQPSQTTIIPSQHHGRRFSGKSGRFPCLGCWQTLAPPLFFATLWLSAWDAPPLRAPNHRGLSWRNIATRASSAFGADHLQYAPIPFTSASWCRIR
jgi:hypothetical protein